MAEIIESLRPETGADTVRILVCATCRATGGDADAPRPGTLLARALRQALDQADTPGIAVETVECLSVCKRPCTVALTGAGRWTYVYGDLDPENGVGTLLTFARQYRETADGIVPWRERAEAIRKGVVARIPSSSDCENPVTSPARSSLTKTPCTIITGFLGAGKTTLVRHLLENAQGKRLAVLVNEFGDLGFDGEFLKGCGVEGCSEDDVVELPNGCICCTVADDFVPALEKLLNRAEPPEHILIETSGLALPKPLVTAFNWPAIRSRVTVDGVIAVVDGPAVAEGQFADDPEALAAQAAQDASVEHDNPLEEVFEDQILCADLILLNKSDLVDAAGRDRVKAEIAAHLPKAIKIVETSRGQIEPALILGLSAAAESDLAARPSHHGEGEDHDHDDFDSMALALPAGLSPETLADRLGRAAEAEGVLRLKGFAAVPGKPMRLVVQGVGRRVSHHFDRPWREGEARDGHLVVIGLKGFDRSGVEAALAG